MMWHSIYLSIFFVQVFHWDNKTKCILGNEIGQAASYPHKLKRNKETQQ